MSAVTAAGYEFPDLRTECELLEPYAVDVRYPETQRIPNEMDARAVLEAGRRIIAAARKFVRTYG